MAFETVRVLIWGKTYPELSSKYVETVCTGGVRSDGAPIRLFPVPLRYMNTDTQYALYDWIDVPVQKSYSDPRPESYKVDAERIVCVAHLDTERGTWSARREAVFRKPEWQFGSMEELKAAQHERQLSLGIVSPGSIMDVRLVEKPPQDRIDYEKKMAEIQGQVDLFRPEYKSLEYLTHEVRLQWRCTSACKECSKKPHDMRALDWGLLELARREGWEKARQKLEEISNLTVYDFRLFMGNFRLHMHVFGVIGMWYPKKAKIPNQMSFFT